MHYFKTQPEFWGPFLQNWSITLVLRINGGFSQWHLLKRANGFWMWEKWRIRNTNKITKLLSQNSINAKVGEQFHDSFFSLNRKDIRHYWAALCRIWTEQASPSIEPSMFCFNLNKYCALTQTSTKSYIIPNKSSKKFLINYFLYVKKLHVLNMCNLRSLDICIYLWIKVIDISVISKSFLCPPFFGCVCVCVSLKNF